MNKQEYQHNWYIKNQSSLKEKNRDYYQLNFEIIKKRRNDRKFVKISWDIKNKYNLDFPQYFQILLDQNFCCAICKIQFDLKRKKTTPHVDHDHLTNKIRGLLCNKCNIAVGWTERYNQYVLEYLSK